MRLGCQARLNPTFDTQRPTTALRLPTSDNEVHVVPGSTLGLVPGMAQSDIRQSATDNHATTTDFRQRGVGCHSMNWLSNVDCRLSSGCRMSAVECRPMPAALTSSPTCVCRCSWDTPGSSRTDCRHSRPSLPRTCAWGHHTLGILGRRFQQLPCRAPRAAPSSDAR